MKPHIFLFWLLVGVVVTVCYYGWKRDVKRAEQQQANLVTGTNFIGSITNSDADWKFVEPAEYVRTYYTIDDMRMAYYQGGGDMVDVIITKIRNPEFDAMGATASNYIAFTNSLIK